jgi:hypothetical protein
MEEVQRNDEKITSAYNAYYGAKDCYHRLKHYYMYAHGIPSKEDLDQWKVVDYPNDPICSVEEQQEIITWVTNNYQNFWDNTTQYHKWMKFDEYDGKDPLPNAFWAIKQRLIEKEKLQHYKTEPCFKDFVNYMLPGAQIHYHRDPNYIERQTHVRYNVIIQKSATKGGMPITEGIVHNVPERSYWKNISSEDFHGTYKVENGETPRIGISYGFLIPEAIVDGLFIEPYYMWFKDDNDYNTKYMASQLDLLQKIQAQTMVFENNIKELVAMLNEKGIEYGPLEDEFVNMSIQALPYYYKAADTSHCYVALDYFDKLFIQRQKNVCAYNGTSTKVKSINELPEELQLLYKKVGKQIPNVDVNDTRYSATLYLLLDGSQLYKASKEYDGMDDIVVANVVMIKPETSFYFGFKGDDILYEVPEGGYWYFEPAKNKSMYTTEIRGNKPLFMIEFIYKRLQNTHKPLTYVNYCDTQEAADKGLACKPIC